jgi:acetolactate synthase regulatory subunit
VANGDEEDFDYETVIDTSKSIEHLMNQVQMKTMDVVLSLENCTTKKTGKEVCISPKLQCVNVILNKSNDEQK